MQVLLRASRIRGCVQALTERSGFLPWLASAAVNYRDLSTSEQDLKEADDLPIMVLQVRYLACPVAAGVVKSDCWL